MNEKNQYFPACDSNPVHQIINPVLFQLTGNRPRPNTDFSMKTIWAISTRPRMIFGQFKSGKKFFELLKIEFEN